ncbi:TPA: hypothetical protein DCG61_01730 [Patescibacteria group bacterium]|jgi:hypothetical protein|nr:hypothetical protein [Patescibacteria group bacterium]
MKNLSLSFDIKGILPALFKKFSLVLWIALALLIVAEGLIIKRSFDKIMTANDSSLYANVQLVRVNFNTYDQIEKRLNENTNFLPSTPVSPDPFGLPPSNSPN